MTPAATRNGREITMHTADTRNAGPVASTDETDQRNTRLVASCRLPTPWAIFRMHGFEEPATGREHVALTLGAVADGKPVLTRVHSECLTGDALFSRRCDCGPQLEAALAAIAAEGRGVLLYLRQEGRGIGLLNKVRAYALQDEGADTVEANHLLGFDADTRDYAVAASMLGELGLASLRLMTNNPRKVAALEQYGITVAERVPHIIEPNPHNANYLRTKAQRLGHLLAGH
ncbi:GTP cyclohydrolase II [Aromatoleum aromaticum]|uniref:GTP cyclohydrolase II n=1 Tax=Aromatoleum aromaticum TaxID=551760 RepID=UPI0031F4556A